MNIMRSRRDKSTGDEASIPSGGLPARSEPVGHRAGVRAEPGRAVHRGRAGDRVRAGADHDQICGTSTPVLAGEEVHARPPTVRPHLLGGLAALSASAAAIHFAVVFEHFAEYALYGVFFLVIAWAQMIWPAVLLWRPSRPWLSLGIAGNAIVIAVYAASRSVGLPFGPDLHHAEPVGALDLMSCLLEFALITGCAALLWRPSLSDRPVARRSAAARVASLVVV